MAKCSQAKAGVAERWKRPLLFAGLAIIMAACGRADRVPPTDHPKPETTAIEAAARMAHSGLHHALYSYRGKPTRMFYRQNQSMPHRRIVVKT